MAITFSNRMKKLTASEIREILKITESPEIISFAGGLPAPEFFPVEEMKEVSVKVLEENGTTALQYSTTEGYVPLREKIAERMNSKLNTDIIYENILITSGSQQGLDLLGKAFLDKGDIVLCESPTYLGAINAFKAYEPRFVEIATDEGGMIIKDLEKTLSTIDNIKMIYVVPDFQNPTGRTWSYSRRKEFIELVNKYMIPVIEDNPYGELRFNGESMPSLKAMDEKDLVIFLGTFSKIFCPGLRIGWIAAEKNLLQKFIMLKQGSDLQSSTRSQMEISKYMELYDIDKNISILKEVYKKRRDIMIHTMEEEFPKTVTFTYPDGGLFTWVELPTHINARALLERCLEKKVAFVPGGSFFPNGGKENTFRLNYSNMQEDRIIEGIKKIGEVIKEINLKGQM